MIILSVQILYIYIYEILTNKLSIYQFLKIIIIAILNMYQCLCCIHFDVFRTGVIMQLKRGSISSAYTKLASENTRL